MYNFTKTGNETQLNEDKDNFDVLYKKFEQTHPDSNFLELYGWNGSQAKPNQYCNAFINGIVKTTMHAGGHALMMSALRGGGPMGIEHT